MRRFAFARIVYLSTGLNHVALPTNHHAYRNILRNIFRDRLCTGLGGRSDRRLAGGGRRRQHTGCRKQWKYVGGGCMGEKTRGPRQEKHPCLKKEQAAP